MTGPSATPDTDGRRPLAVAIFDVDGVLLASPHERAWREALAGFADPAPFTTALYQARVAGKPRLAGAIAALAALGVADAERRAPAYAAAKQARLEAILAGGPVAAFPDALRFLRALRSLSWRCAVASSSQNADAMMRTVTTGPGQSLIDQFAANVCGRPVARGKPDPEIFLMAATALGAAPATCLVIEDAPAGIEAARAGGMGALGVARLHDEADLWAAGAGLVVDSLDQVSLRALADGRLVKAAA